MRRLIPNQYKLKRKWGRRLKKASRLTDSILYEPAKSRRDFSWRGSKANPYDHKRGKWSRKLKIELVILAASLLIMAGLGIFHPFFLIKKVEVKGLQRINEMEFKDSVLGMINYKKLFLFPGQSYFIVDVKEVSEIIKQRFPIESIIIKKTFPNTLDIQLEEKISTIIYDNGKEYSYVGLDGKVVEILRKVGGDEWHEEKKTVTSTNELGEEISEEKVVNRYHRPPIANIINELGDYPIVYDKRGLDSSVNAEVFNQNISQGIIKWFNLINKRSDIPFGYITLDNELGEGIIKTREGWEIRVGLIIEKVENQFEELQYILKEKIARPNLNYIDLRYQGRVYWQ